jgi:eukaryotic-like serine/threonine-protein kinase
MSSESSGRAGEPSPDERTPDSPKPLVDGSRALGRYKLLSVLGEGGMGVVYLAEQVEPVRRRVAIKVLKLGMDTEQVLARFESERQALAVMDHPGIAKVLGGGKTSSGRPYFVMEVVHGVPITQYADVHRLNTAERLRLFMDVCAAVQHAHLKGVIHRDLKPSNVMVAVAEAGPMVRVIDFGIAKAVGAGLTDHTLVTRVGQIVGTPEYMSPEQAEASELDVDSRTDIYSLGVMLYELVVGARPFDHSVRPDYDLPAVLREREIPRPSTRLTNLGDTLETVARHRRTTPEGLRRELRGDLDWIILKAMAKDRTRRYETANGLRLDILRHLEHEPVRARPPSARYRIGKFVRRNRPAVLAAGVAALAVLGGAGAATMGFLEAVEERERAEAAAATSEQISTFLVDLFSVSNPSEARGATITAREVLDRGVARISAGLSDQPSVQATLMRVMGSVYLGLGLYDDAAELLEQAVAVGEAHPQEVDAVERARVHNRLGGAYRHLSRPDDAARAFEAAETLAEGAGDDGVLERTVAVRGLGSLEIQAGRFDDAEGILRATLDAQETALGPDHLEVGITAGALGALELYRQEPEAALPHLNRAVATRERWQGREHPEVLLTRSNLGVAYVLSGDFLRAEETYRRVLAGQLQVVGEDHPDVAMARTNLGHALLSQARLEEAEGELVRALAIRERALGPHHTDLVSTLLYLGHALRGQGRNAEAESAYRRALTIMEAADVPPPGRMQEVLSSYAELLRAEEREAEAEGIDRRIAALTQR